MGIFCDIINFGKTLKHIMGKLDELNAAVAAVVDRDAKVLAMLQELKDKVASGLGVAEADLQPAIDALTAEVVKDDAALG